MRNPKEFSDKDKIEVLEQIVSCVFGGCQFDWKQHFGIGRSVVLRNVNYIDNEDIAILNKMSDNFDVTIEPRAYINKDIEFKDAKQIVIRTDIELEENYENATIRDEKSLKEYVDYMTDLQWTSDETKKYDHMWVKDEEGFSTKYIPFKALEKDHKA